MKNVAVLSVIYIQSSLGIQELVPAPASPPATKSEAAVGIYLRHILLPTLFLLSYSQFTLLSSLSHP